MSDESASTKQPKSWREDILSVFLIVAAVLLGVMYAWDQWQTSRLEEQIARAEQIGQSFAVDGANCEVSSAGLTGKTLVLSCPGLKTDKIAAFASGVDALAQGAVHFDEVLVRGVDGKMQCSVEVKGWPEGCEALQNN